MAGCLASPAGVSAAVTIGSSLSSTPSVSACAGGSACTYLQTALPSASRAPGGLTAPGDGVVVRWKLKAGSVGGTAQLRVLRPAAGGGFTGAGASALEMVTQVEPAVNGYTTSLPIKAGDSVGLDNATGGVYFAATASASVARYSPALMATETRAPTSSDAGRELLVQADIEADCDRDGLGDETQDTDLSPCAPVVPSSAPNPPPPAQKGPTSLIGTRVTGTAGPDSVLCGPGNSVVRGLDGDDKIVCGPGDDDIDAGGGKDTVDAGGGSDHIRGGSGNDNLLGGGGNDRVSGASGADRLGGGTGRDRLAGSGGDDSLSGSSGEDALSGGTGDDALSGGSGDDSLTGGSGEDHLAGGSGNDQISARDGARDRIDCGRGRDRVAADRRDRVSADCERVTRGRR
jgi:RTX calcium-binding nonapeptide repeat (4 copies)